MYEEFNGTMRVRSNSKIPMCTIQKNGSFIFNTRCYLFFEGYKFAFFLYDKEFNKIGIRPTNKVSTNVFNIRPANHRNNIGISCTAFLKHFNIIYLSAKSFPCVWNEAEKILEIQL